MSALVQVTVSGDHRGDLERQPANTKSGVRTGQDVANRARTVDLDERAGGRSLVSTGTNASEILGVRRGRNFHP